MTSEPSVYRPISNLLAVAAFVRLHGGKILISGLEEDLANEFTAALARSELQETVKLVRPSPGIYQIFCAPRKLMTTEDGVLP